MSTDLVATLPITVPWSFSGSCVLDAGGNGTIQANVPNRWYRAWMVTYGTITGTTNPVSVTFVIDGRTGQSYQGAQAANFTVSGIELNLALQFSGGTAGDLIRVGIAGSGSTSADAIGPSVTLNSTFGAAGGTLGVNNVLASVHEVLIASPGVLLLPLLPYTGPATIMVQSVLSNKWDMQLLFADSAGNPVAGVQLLDQSTAVPMINLFLPLLITTIKIENNDTTPLSRRFDALAVAAVQGTGVIL